MTNKKIRMNEIIIKEIELYNFMCHKHLKVVFKNKITCISGRNGSGKSSIMIAIGILLGERVSNMERGTLKNLIKKGETNSIIIIKLNNYKRYKEEFFKEGIIKIQRSISLITNNTFKITNEKGNIFSKKVEDLNYILDIYNINLNILNFLTQDNSKKFLNITNSKDLYELFIDSTNIKIINNLYLEAKGYINLIEIKIKEIKEEIKEIKKEKEKINLIIKINKEKENNKKEIKLLNLIIKKKEINKIKEKIKEKKEKIKEKEKELINLNKKIKEEKEEKEELIKKNKEKQINYFNFLDLKNKEKKEIELNKIEIKNDIQMFKEEIKNQLNELKKYNKKNYEIELENHLINSINQLNELIKEKDLINKENNLIEKNKEEFINKKEEIKKNIYLLEKQISFYKKQEENNLNFFGLNIKNILNEIKYNKFNDLIIGPIGLYLELKDNKYSIAISIALKNRLSSFIVFNNEDSKILTNIFNKYNVNYPLIIPSKKYYNINYFKEDSIYNSILNILIIKDYKEIIRDNLIMFDFIETTYLSDNRIIAYQILNKLKNVDSIFTKDGDRIKVINKVLTEFRPKIIKSYFKGNQIELLNKKLNSFTSQLISNPLNDEIFNKVILNKDILFKLNNKIELKTKEIKEIEFEKKLLIQEKNLDDIENKEKLKKKLEKEIEITNEQLINAEAQLEEFNVLLNKIEDEIKEEKKNVNESLKISLPETLSNKNLHMEKLIIESDLIAFRNMCLVLEDNENRQSEKFIEAMNQEGIVYTDIVDMYGTIEDVNCRIELLTEYIGNIDNINEADVQKKEKLLKEEMGKKKELVDKYLIEIEKYNKESEMGLKKMEMFKEEISEEVSNKFTENTFIRNYKGKLLFNHEEAEIEVLLSNVADQFSGNRGTLSGGERSFAGICLLLSIYNFIKSPLKILDECDVFMDNLNRNASFKLIFDFFKFRDDQVILITPMGFKGFDCDVITIEKTES